MLLSRLTRRDVLKGVVASGIILAASSRNRGAVGDPAAGPTCEPFELYLDVPPLASLPAALRPWRDLEDPLRAGVRTALPRLGPLQGFRILRARDLLLMDVRLRNLTVAARHPIQGRFGASGSSGEDARAGQRERHPRPVLHVTRPGQPGLLRFSLQAQHVAEASYAFSVVPEAGLPYPVPAALSGRSHLVFELPSLYADHRYGYPLDLESLLDWDRFALHCFPTALPRVGACLPDLSEAVVHERAGHRPQPPFDLGTGLRGKTLFEFPYDDSFIDRNGAVRPPQEADAWFTALELPSLLFLSPHGFHEWRTRRGLDPRQRSRAGTAELWHASAMAPFAYGDDLVASALHKLNTARVIWGRGADDERLGSAPPECPSLVAQEPAVASPFFPRPMHGWNLVELTSNFGLAKRESIKVTKGAAYDAEPVDLHALHVASLGGSLLAHGSWDPSLVIDPARNPPDALMVDEWLQDTVGGRDANVLVSIKGYLMPFGHEASLVEVRQREFHAGWRRGERGTLAPLRARWFIKIRERTKDYRDVSQGSADAGASTPLRGRRMPFQSVTLLDDRTPYLANPMAVGPGAKPNPMWLVDGVVGEDLKDHQSTKYPFAIWAIPEGVGGEEAARHAFRYGMRCVDRQGNALDFRLPLVWVARTIAERPSPENGKLEVSCGLDRERRKAIFKRILERYCQETTLRTAGAGGQRMAWIPKGSRPRAHVQEDALATRELIFGCETDSNDIDTGVTPMAWTESGQDVQAASSNFTTKVLDPSEPAGPARDAPLPENWDTVRFYPALACAMVDLDAVAQFAPASANKPTCLAYDPSYVWGGLPAAEAPPPSPAPPGSAPPSRPSVANVGEVYARVEGKAAAPAVDFGPENAGGLANPSMNVNGLSRSAGPIAGPVGHTVDFSKGTFDPAKVFEALDNGLEAKLLGAVRLRDVLKLLGDVGEKLASIPKLIKESVPPVVQEIAKLEELFRRWRGVAETIQAVAVDLVSGKLARRLSEGLERQFPALTDSLLSWARIEASPAAARAIAALTEAAASLRTGLAALVVGARDRVHDLTTAWAGMTQPLMEALRGVSEEEAKRLAILRDSISELQDAPKAWAASIAALGEQQLGQAIAKGTEAARAVERELRDAVLEAPRALLAGMDKLMEPLEGLRAIGDQPLRAVQALRAALDGVVAVLSRPEILSPEDIVSRVQSRLKVAVERIGSDVRQRWTGALGQLMVVETDAPGAAFRDLGTNIADTRAKLGQLDESFASLPLDVGKRLFPAFDAGRSACECALKDMELLAPRVTTFLEQVSHARANLLQALPALPDAPSVESAGDLAKRLNALRDQVTQTVKEPPKEVLQAIEAFRPALEALAHDINAGLLQPLKQQLPGLESINRELREVLDHIPQDVSVKYDWDLELKDFPGEGKEALFQASREPATGGRKDATFKIHSAMSQSVGQALGGQLRPRLEVSAVLRDFTLRLLPGLEFLLVSFEQIRFGSGGGGGRDVEVQLGDIRFGAELEFIQSLSSAFGRGSGLLIDLSSRGILVAWRWALPTISSGALNLYQLAFSIGVRIPFQRDDPLLLHLGVSTRELPFVLTIGLYGGGGHFALELAPDGLRHLESSLEFGATVGLDIGVASGIVYARGGVFYSCTIRGADKQRTIVVTAYFRAGGALSILGLINLYVDFYVGLSYVSRGGQSYFEGIARLTVRIEIFFFSIGVTLEVRQTLAGSAGGDQGAHGLPGLRGIEGPTSSVYEPRTGRTAPGSAHATGRSALRNWQPLNARDWAAEVERWEEHLVLVGACDWTREHR